ncbi:MAG: WD40 repeat domain-containing protein [Calothrix sp. SM1_5_4]|nr:WD40 repeat domain-containing protein [Calothrix sp. SM1_5_4]
MVTLTTSNGAFSPCQTRIATTSQDGRVRIFELSGELLWTFDAHQGCASACAWSQDGLRLVSSGDDGSIRIWNVESGVMENELRPSEMQTDCVVIDAEGIVYTGNDHGEIYRISGSGLTNIKVHRAGIKNLCISHDGKLLVSMSYDRDLALIDIAAGDLRIRNKVHIPGSIWVRACAFQNSDRLVFGTFGSTYASLDLKTLSWDFDRIGPTDCLNALHLSGSTLYAVGDSGQVRQSPVSGPRGLLKSIKPGLSVAEMGSLCNFITEYNGQLVTGGHLGDVFDAHTGEVLLSLKGPINKAIQAHGFLVLATYVGELAICRSRGDGSLELVGVFKALTNAIKDLCTEGKQIFCAGAAADIALFDLEQRSLVGRRDRAHDNIVNSCAALGEGRFATVSRDLHLKIWHGLELEKDLLTPHDHSIKCMAVSHDKRYLATCSYDGKVAVLDRHDLSWPVFRRLTAAGISSVTFAESSFWAASYDGQVFQVPAWTF